MHRHQRLHAGGSGTLLRRGFRWLIEFLVSLVPLWWLGCPSTCAAEPEPQLKAGAATSNITPRLGVSINGGMSDRRATHIHDELHARCLVLDDGKTRLAFAVCDMCMIPREVMDEAKQIVNQTTGLPVENMLISATHTHEAPTAAGVFQSDPDPEYPKFLATRIADGIRRAINNLEPAKIGWGVGKEPTQVFNRRWFMKPGLAL